MIIEEADFRMTSSAGPFWDLELLHTIRPKGKPERQEFKDGGFGLTILSCAQRIINHRLGQKKDVYTLKEYVKDYKEQVSILKDLLKDM